MRAAGAAVTASSKLSKAAAAVLAFFAIVNEYPGSAVALTPEGIASTGAKKQISVSRMRLIEYDCGDTGGVRPATLA
jgi:hypothetical protein